ncbi:SpoIIE family protein phosphatase [Lentzea sp. DG1S-22]|uniref:SpoIIE family protein phosphatase n=1 Tax=Lentzea sp. DG1S-22 TaxID=3108822 RepID=UPI002E77C875|nr:SpoIIE family protein phosphatase [Lentzea sp. DG1S-22]WVH83152.1 SpoIIE family protein phosphatase [Lentzea sp. DG1S-22]
MTSSDGIGHRQDEPGPAGVFAGSGEIGRGLAAVDWAATPVGPPDEWPQSLQTAVSILLSSRFSMWMAWGPELTFFCNNAYRLNTLGRKYPWALGRPAAEVWAEIWDDIGPRVDSVLTTGRATWDEALLLFLERSGYTEETYHTFSYSPLRDESGAVAGMLCVVSEETERVIGERRMATLRDLGSNPSVARDEREVLASACDQLDRNRYDLPFTLTYLFDDGHARLAGSTGVEPEHPAAPAVIRDGEPVWPVGAARRGESTVVELGATAGLPAGPWPRPPAQALVAPLQRPGRTPHGFLVAGLNRHRPLDDGYRGFVELVAGHLAAGVAGARDFRAQQRRAEELAELDRAKTAFFSNISHEFRTPLTLIMGPVQELRDRLPLQDPQAAGELEVIHRNGLRLGKLVNTLLDFSRLEAGRMQASFQPVDLPAVTAELASVFRSAVEKAGLAFEIDCAPLPAPVHVDLGLWEKVVLNLLSNALKFTVDGAVGVSVRAGAGGAVVTVSDTGVGVPEHEMPRLFERFHRIEHSWSRSKEGSGIGLALVQELVGLHGGTIRAESTEGVGTRFTIELPFGTDHLPADAISQEPVPPTVTDIAAPYVQEALRWLPDPGQAPDELPRSTSAGGAPEALATVLVADDNADMREYLTRLLLRAGYEVRTVNDGVAALEAVRAQPPDLVVSDVMMPRMDGLSLVAALRADPRTMAVPVLLLSARAGQEASGEGLRAGADDYLVKPFAAADLLARVRANVDLARLRGRHARWRDALIDSLQEAFFVCDDEGTVVEINSAFTEILGYGPEGLPYPAPHPWWPDAETEPEECKQFTDAFEARSGHDHHGLTVPVTHRDGRRLWINAMMNPARDPDSGRTMTVGTFRDVTAEHHARRREIALAEMNMRLSRATSAADALTAALEQMERLWRAEHVLAVVFDRHSAPRVSGATSRLVWEELPEDRRAALTALSRNGALIPVLLDDGAIAVTVEHPDGPMVLWLRLDARHHFTEQDELLLALLAGHLTQGLARARQIDQQRETALALQRAILGPSRLPGGFAVRYEPAARLEVGGDWYDTFPLRDGRIGIVVGDCVGRGLSAAAVMGQLRSACRALLLQEIGPARALTALDQFAAGVPGALCTTVFCGVLDPATGRLVYSSAGHPPAILALADGTTQLLEEGRSIPLAVKLDLPRTEAQCVLPPRSTLLTYTDGLVERRTSSLTEGIEKAAHAVQKGRANGLEDLAGQIMEDLAPEGGYDDDVALLLYRHPAPLEVVFPAEAGELHGARNTLRAWLDQCGFSTSLAQRVLLAVGEASTNAIEHAYRDVVRRGVRLRLETAGDHQLLVTVADTGTWKTPSADPAERRGRGTAIMEKMMDEVAILPDPTGTTVTMQVMIPHDDAVDADQIRGLAGQVPHHGEG